MKIHLCSVCYQVSIKTGNDNKPITCCEKEMTEFKKINQIISDDDNKHFPIVRKIGNFVTITIEDNHPMLEVHKIEFILIKTNHGFLYKDIRNQEKAKAEFILANDEKIVNIYVNCNVHSLSSLH